MINNKKPKRKIWGTQHRLLSTKHLIVDLLYLRKDTACSIHLHENKINKFIVITGKVKVSTSMDSKILTPTKKFVVDPFCAHRFRVLENAIMVEIITPNKGIIDENDITRLRQGGKFIDGKFYTLDELREKKLLTKDEQDIT